MVTRWAPYHGKGSEISPSFSHLSAGSPSPSLTSTLPCAVKKLYSHPDYGEETVIPCHIPNCKFLDWVSQFLPTTPRTAPRPFPVFPPLLRPHPRAPRTWSQKSPVSLPGALGSLQPPPLSWAAGMQREPVLSGDPAALSKEARGFVLTSFLINRQNPRMDAAN